MRFVMFEKTPSGYKICDGMIYWTNSSGDYHKEYGPAILYDTGNLCWYNHGVCTKRLNVENDEEQIKTIINNIDFKQIHSVMNFLNWKWGYENPHIPNIKELKAEVRRLLRSVKKFRNCDEPYIISYGCFEGYACKSGFGIKFVVDSWDTT